MALPISSPGEFCRTAKLAALLAFSTTPHTTQNVNLRMAASLADRPPQLRQICAVTAGADGRARGSKGTRREFARSRPESCGWRCGARADTAVGLADVEAALAEELLQAWPREERPLTVAERYELQQLLGQRGFDIGEPDGRIGPRTRIAIRNFQVATGQFPDGFPSSHVLDRLRQP